MRIIIHTEAQYLPAFREVAKAVKARLEEVMDGESNETEKTLDELIAAGILQPAKPIAQKSLSDVLNQFNDYPLTYEDAKTLRRDAWKRNG